MGRKPVVVFAAIAAFAYVAIAGLTLFRIANASTLGREEANDGFKDVRTLYATASSPSSFARLSASARELYARDRRLAGLVVYHDQRRVAYSLPAKAPFRVDSAVWNGYPEYRYDPAAVVRLTSPIALPGHPGWSVDALYITLTAEELFIPLRDATIACAAIFLASLIMLFAAGPEQAVRREASFGSGDAMDAEFERSSPYAPPLEHASAGTFDSLEPNLPPLDSPPMGLFDEEEPEIPFEVPDLEDDAATPERGDVSFGLPSEELIDPSSFETPLSVSDQDRPLPEPPFEPSARSEHHDAIDAPREHARIPDSPSRTFDVDLTKPAQAPSRTFADALLDDGVETTPIDASGSDEPPRDAITQSGRPPAEPHGLFSPKSGLGWQSYLKDRLDFELSRSASFEQDLCLVLFDCEPAAHYGDIYRKLAGLLRDFFSFRDLSFEYGDSGFAVILPNTNFDHAMRMAEDFLKKTTFLLRTADGAAFSQSLYIGFSSRAGRLIDSSRILEEADGALRKAREEGGARLLGFKPNADRFRDFLRQKAAD
jgi:GGDEF domain-containing protein